MSTRNGTHAPTSTTADLATRLLQAKLTGHLDSQLAPALISLLEQLHGSLTTGQVDAATASINDALGPVVAFTQAQTTLVASLHGFDAALNDCQRVRGTSDPTAFVADTAFLSTLSERLRALADASEDSIARVDHYLRVIAASRA
jgi:hypothetical protein